MANERPIPTSLPEWQKATNRRIAMLERAVNTRARTSQVSISLDGKMPVYWAGQDGYTASNVPTDFPTGITYFYVFGAAGGFPGATSENRLVRVTKYKGVDTMAVQEVFNGRGGGDVFTRVATAAGGWTAWTEAASKSYVDAKTWDAATDLTGVIADGNMPTSLRDFAELVTDFDNAIDSGFYRGNNAANAPGSSAWYYVMAINHNDLYVQQVAWDYFSHQAYTRTKNNGTWLAWAEISGPDGSLPGVSANAALSGTAAPSTFENGLTIGRTGAGAGWPVAAWAPVHVFKAGNDEDVTQIVYMRGNGTSPNRTYVRSSTYNGSGVAATWGVWREISQVDGVWYSNFSSVQTNILLSSVTNAEVSYMLEGPWVNMTGLVGKTGGWSTSAETLCFTLPSNARPERREFLPAITTETGRGANGTWAIEPAGTVTLRPHTGAYGAGYYSFSGVRFYRG